jgi:hypothetical protein
MNKPWFKGPQIYKGRISKTGFSGPVFRPISWEGWLILTLVVLIIISSAFFSEQERAIIYIFDLVFFFCVASWKRVP